MDVAGRLWKYCPKTPLVISNRSEKSPGEADPPQADELVDERALRAGMLSFGQHDEAVLTDVREH